jgi:hypothetical protein
MAASSAAAAAASDGSRVGVGGNGVGTPSAVGSTVAHPCSDVSQADIVLLLETVASVELPGDDGGAALRRRYLSLLLQALRAPGLERLPGQPAREADLTARWRTRRQTKTGGSR